MKDAVAIEVGGVRVVVSVEGRTSASVEPTAEAGGTADSGLATEPGIKFRRYMPFPAVGDPAPAGATAHDAIRILREHLAADADRMKLLQDKADLQFKLGKIGEELFLEKKRNQKLEADLDAARRALEALRLEAKRERDDTARLLWHDNFGRAARAKVSMLAQQGMRVVQVVFERDAATPGACDKRYAMLDQFARVVWCDGYLTSTANPVVEKRP